MSFLSFFQLTAREDLRSRGDWRPARGPLAAGAVVVALSMVAIFSLAPPAPPTEAQLLQAYLDAHAQGLKVSSTVAAADVTRDGYSATPGIATLVAGGTNHDWAKLVLLDAGLPINDITVTVFTRWMRQENGADDWWNRNNPLNNGWGSGGGGGTGTYDNLQIAAENAAEALDAGLPINDITVTVFTRWMRQENGADDWWNRNNPLNNGWGSGGGGGTGTYDNLQIAAENAAEALLNNGGYSGIVAAFAAASSTESIEQAIWASPWASGHYDYGGHWAYTTVSTVSAPADAWG